MTEDIDQGRRRLVATAAAAVTGLEPGMLGTTKTLLHGLGTTWTEGLSALRGATAWLNSPPLSDTSLRGNVVVLDVWTYSCINWLRSLPYVRAWAQRYREHGLVVIGVHTPEFEFEHDLDRVRRAARQMDIRYPIAIDNDYAIWHALDNHYWPALYFIDARGDIRHRKFGEGDYQRSEAVLQGLLAESGARGIDHQMVSVAGVGVEAAADWDDLATPETYLGYARVERLAAPLRVVQDTRHAYTAPKRLRRNEWALDGTWTVARQAVTLGAPGGRLVCRFQARDLHLVMGPAERERSIRFRVRIDGREPGAAHGVDIDAQGNGVVSEHRLYQLIRQPRPIVERQCELEFLDPGVETYAFTFG